jgi:NTE family protein
MKRKIGLALSGGGIKAFCQIGAVRSLLENNIICDGFAGTSMGSIVATFLAMGLDIDTVEKEILDLEQKIIELKLFKSKKIQLYPLFTQKADGLLDGCSFENLIKQVLIKYNVTKMNDIKTPLVLCSVDLVSGKRVLFTNQANEFRNITNMIIIDTIEISKAIQASCAFPLVFNTVSLDSMQLVDGGVLMNVPVQPLRDLGYEKVISISMMDNSDYVEVHKMKNIAERIIEIMTKVSDTHMLDLADFTINISNKQVSIFSFGHGKKMIDYGYKKTQEYLLSQDAKKLKKKRFFL